MVRAVVAVPPVRDFYRTRHRHSALGARVVYTILNDSGWDASFFNFPILAKKGKPFPLPEEMKYLAPYIIPEERGPTAFFTRFQHFGPTYEECRDRILAKNPSVLFLSCFAFCYGEEVLNLAEAVKKKRPEILIAVGGAGGSVHPGYFLKHPAVSLVFTGEIEETLPLFIQEYQQGKYSSSICTSACISKNPPGRIYPAWALTEETSRQRSIAVSVTRGCPKSCKFCSVHLSQGNTFRKASMESINKMVAEIPDSKNVRCNFEDDNLLCDPSYFLSVLKTFTARFPSIEFTAENGIDYSMLTPSLLEELIGLGFRQFNLSLASVSARILSSQSRAGDLALYEELLTVLAKHAIPSVTYFICGLKDDTVDTVADSLLYLAAQPTKIGISLFYPVPGIRDFTRKSIFDSVNPRLTASSSAFPWNKSLTTGQMITAFRLARFINMQKSSSASAADSHLLETIFAARCLYSAVSTGGAGETLIPIEHMDADMTESVLDGLLNNSGTISETS